MREREKKKKKKERICSGKMFKCSSHLWFMPSPREKAWTEPEELVATSTSGNCVDGPNDKENIVEGYAPLLKL